MAFPPIATWLAFRADDPEKIARSLRLRTLLPASWSAGLAEVVTEGVFVTPPVRGWVFAVGRDLAVSTQDSAAMEALLCGLSQDYGKVMWFSTDEERDVHGWAIADRGELVRGYAYIEEYGHTFWHGEILPAESDLGCFQDDPRDQSDDQVKWWPDRQVVFALAAAWSLDPSTLGSKAMGQYGQWDDVSPGVGFVGRM